MPTSTAVNDSNISSKATSTFDSVIPSLSFGPITPLDQCLIHDAFSHHAKEHPDLLAIRHSGEVLTYHDLNQLSNKVAAYLLSTGIKRGTRVVLLASRSATMIIGLFGVLKAGASYIPIDGGIVTDMALAAIIKDAKPAAILSLRKHSHCVQGINVPVFVIDELLCSTQVHVEEVKGNDATQDSDEAYVIYTSGTTGYPKGVSVSHRNVTNLLLLYPGNLSIHPGINVSQLLNISFDMAAWEILGCLCNGGTLVLRPSGPGPTSWVETLKEVDVVIVTPSILAQFAAGDFKNIKVVATAGERCSQKLADEWSRGRVFWNCCGPTETTIINTAHFHTPNTPNTIGRPTPNNAVYVLNDDLQPVPIGMSGTLWAGGLGVCKGYVELPELTRKRFLPDPFSPWGIMYNTGDIGRLRPDGEFDHLGRVDDQVKIKGFRVELDGVAAAVSSCPGVLSSATLLIDGLLWAFYTPLNVAAKDVERIVEHIQPYYARPSKYVAMENLPLTINGKVDKVELTLRAKCLLHSNV